MAWTNSKIFSSYLTDVLNNTTAIDLNTDTLIEAALFDNTITPNQSDTSAHNAYAAAGGSWASGGVVDTGSSAPAGWPALGRPLQSPTSTFSANVFTFDAADTVSANGVTSLTNAYGTLIYDHSISTPVADQGICYLYFGGANSVVLGTFTIVWNASGLMTLTL